MPSKKTTTVVLTPEALEIKNRIAGAFSLKGVFSAGMIWFNRLDTDTMIDIVSTAKKNAPLLPLIESIDHSKKIKKAITFVQKVKNDFGGSEPVPFDVHWLCNEILSILTAPKIEEDIEEDKLEELARQIGPEEPKEPEKPEAKEPKKDKTARS